MNAVTYLLASQLHRHLIRASEGKQDIQGDVHCTEFFPTAIHFQFSAITSGTPPPQYSATTKLKSYISCD